MYIFDTKQKIHYFLLFMIFSYFCECCLFSSVLATKVKKKNVKNQKTENGQFNRGGSESG